MLMYYILYFNITSLSNEIYYKWLCALEDNSDYKKKEIKTKTEVQPELS